MHIILHKEKKQSESNKKKKLSIWIWNLKKQNKIIIKINEFANIFCLFYYDVDGFVCQKTSFLNTQKNADSYCGSEGCSLTSENGEKITLNYINFLSAL